jgi:hypothetical protein
MPSVPGGGNRTYAGAVAGIPAWKLPELVTVKDSPAVLTRSYADVTRSSVVSRGPLTRLQSKSKP